MSIKNKYNKIIILILTIITFVNTNIYISAEAIKSPFNVNLGIYDTIEYRKILKEIYDVSVENNFNPYIAAALAIEESGLNKDIVNSDNCYGLYQFSPIVLQYMNIERSQIESIRSQVELMIKLYNLKSKDSVNTWYTLYYYGFGYVDENYYESDFIFKIRALYLYLKGYQMNYKQYLKCTYILGIYE